MTDSGFPTVIFNLITIFERVDPNLQLMLLDASAEELNRRIDSDEMKSSVLGRSMVRGYYRKANGFCRWDRLHPPYGDLDRIIGTFKRCRGLLRSWGEGL